jgi:septum formation topological specificity factor MinE
MKIILYVADRWLDFKKKISLKVVHAATRDKGVESNCYSSITSDILSVISSNVYVQDRIFRHAY